MRTAKPYVQLDPAVIEQARQMDLLSYLQRYEPSNLKRANMSVGSLTKDMSIHYTTLFPKIVSSALIVSVMFLLVIVTVHSISVEIETNYVTFGDLKA